MRLSLKASFAAALASLSALVFAAAASAPSARAAVEPQPPTGWKMLVHQMSSTYLFPDNYAD
ncbi:hypothetical protein AB0950_39930 [Streptomyces sp. NPDC007189]|uniref:hypothetical protein n=1 Tax=Streptomyces sp. NPDC007189 TaxID=3154315 RepID=UPI0034541F0A